MEPGVYAQYDVEADKMWCVVGPDVIYYIYKL